MMSSSAPPPARPDHHHLQRRTLAYLAIALAVLAVLQFLHLLDDLRTEPTATLLSALAKPQAMAGIGGAFTAAVLVASNHPWGRRLALFTATLVSLGFLVVHGSPVNAAPFRPYWGQGSADAIQWVGVVLIWTCSAVVIVLCTRQVSS